MNSYSEYPGVEDGVDRRLTFPKINWLTKAKFEDLLTERQRDEIHPFVVNKHIKDNKARFIYVGKSIPEIPIGPINQLGTLPFNFYELIGNVYYSIDDEKWKLRVTHNGQTHDIEHNFLVLFLPNPDSFFWSSDTFIAKYALRAAVDISDSKYNLIGRAVEEAPDQPKRPKYYANGWYYFEEPIDQMFGRINKSYKLMFGPINRLEVGFDQYETLCLKASPAPLKTLCRTAVRSYVNYSQKNIKALNQNHLVPDALIDYLKYPPFLAVGEYMLNTEKLVQENDMYELAFDQKTGHLVCRCLDNQQISNLESIIAQNIDLIWLHPSGQTVFSNQINSIVNTIYSVNDLRSYKFCVNWDKANYQIV